MYKYGWSPDPPYLNRHISPACEAKNLIIEKQNLSVSEDTHYVIIISS